VTISNFDTNAPTPINPSGSKENLNTGYKIFSPKPEYPEVRRKEKEGRENGKGKYFDCLKRTAVEF
jgi:hypothetical protein